MATHQDESDVTAPVATMSPCPAPEALELLLADSLDAAQRPEVEAHVGDCPHCQDALRRRLDEQAEHLQPLLRADDTANSTLDQTGPPPPLLERLRQMPLVSRARLLAEPARTTPEPTAPALPGHEMLRVLGR